VEHEVLVPDEAVVREAAGGVDLVGGLADLEDAHVVLCALVVPVLAGVRDRGLHPGGVPGPLGPDHAAVLAVLVAEELDAETLAVALEAVALRGGDGVHHRAGLHGLGDIHFLAEDALGVLDPGLEVPAADADLHDLRRLLGDPGDLRGLCVGEHADVLELGLFVHEAPLAVGVLVAREREALGELAVQLLGPDLGEGLKPVGGALVGAHGGDLHRRGLDDGDRHEDLLSARRGGGTVVLDVRVGHPGLVAGESEEPGLGSIAIGPGADARGLAPDAVPVPVPPRTPLRVVLLSHGWTLLVCRAESASGFLAVLPWTVKGPSGPLV
jgi:hypothetical protein